MEASLHSQLSLPKEKSKRNAKKRAKREENKVVRSIKLNKRKKKSEKK